MAKWEIRFQRFALSFRLSALDVCRASCNFSLPPLALAGVRASGRNVTILGLAL
jgi:hypothetical protein